MRVSYMRFSKSGKTFQTGLKTASRSTALLKTRTLRFSPKLAKTPKEAVRARNTPYTRYDQRAGDGRAQRQRQTGASVLHRMRTASESDHPLCHSPDIARSAALSR